VRYSIALRLVQPVWWA